MVMLGNNPIRYKKASGTADSLNELICPLIMKTNWQSGTSIWLRLTLSMNHWEDLGLSLNDPDIWIGDTGAMTHNTAYLKNAVNHRAATVQDNIAGVTGPPAKSKLIGDIPYKTNCEGRKTQFVIKDVVSVPDSHYNLFSLTKLMSNR
jgi:hypothetical protein